jgi:hypothetical protein
MNEWQRVKVVFTSTHVSYEPVLLVTERKIENLESPIEGKFRCNMYIHY